MTSHLFRGEDAERGHQPESNFDPIAEGARYQLAAAVSLAIWERVSRERIGGSWRSDEDGAAKQIARKTLTRIKALATAAATRGKQESPYLHSARSRVFATSTS